MRDRPSSTAAFVAACRTLGRRLPRDAQLADDPFGALFDDGMLSLFARHAPRWATLPFWPVALYMQVRTRVIDDVLRAFVAPSSARHDEPDPGEAVSKGARQVVILGAGYDCRAVRFAAELPTTRVFEVDHPLTQARKRDVLDRAGISVPHATYVPWDFESRPVSELPAALAALGHVATRPTLTLWEGVTMYLSEPAIESTVAAVHEYSCADSQLLFTYFDRARIQRPDPLRRIVAQFVARGGEPFRFGWSPPELPAWLSARGYALAWDRTAKSFADDLLPPAHRRMVQDSKSHIASARVVASPKPEKIPPFAWGFSCRRSSRRSDSRSRPSDRPNRCSRGPRRGRSDCGGAT